MQKFEQAEEEADYLSWLAANPDGYVVNATRPPNARYSILHRSDCRTINGTPPTGSGWTNSYQKVCGTRAELEKWSREEAGGETAPCGTCLG